MSTSFLPFETNTPTGRILVPNPVIYKYDGEHRFLSNFAACHVTLPAEQNLPSYDFMSVENAYVAWKTLEYSVRVQVAGMTPGAAKDYSKQDDFPLRPDFTDDNRIAIMTQLVEQKFSDKNPSLLEQLLATKEMTLVEGNTWRDSFFGFDLIGGFGDNHLGRIQMAIRRQRMAEQNVTNL